MSRIVLVSNRVAGPAQGRAGRRRRRRARRHRARAQRPVVRLERRDRDRSEEQRRRRRRRGRRTVATLPLSAREHDGYYLGYANSVLWPVFHNRLDLAQFEAGYFERYLDVNRRLRRALQPMLRPDDIIWVHDYHLIPFAAELQEARRAEPDRLLPAHPVPALADVHGHPRAPASWRARSPPTISSACRPRPTSPTSSTTWRTASSAASCRTAASALFDRLRVDRQLPGRHRRRRLRQGQARRAACVQAPPAIARIIGVDRLDYTKGLPQKFKAFGRFLEKYPQYRRKVVLTQIAPPTRESVEAYSDIRQQLESAAGSINGRFGELDWVPIHYIHRSTPRRRLADIYRSSRIGMVTPLRDGMNLVAKEYVAAQDPDDPGVLDPVALCRRGRGDDGGADRQSLQHRGDGRRHQGGARDGADRAPGAAIRRCSTAFAATTRSAGAARSSARSRASAGAAPSPFPPRRPRRRARRCRKSSWHAYRPACVRIEESCAARCRHGAFANGSRPPTKVI